MDKLRKLLQEELSQPSRSSFLDAELQKRELLNRAARRRKQQRKQVEEENIVNYNVIIRLADVLRDLLEHEGWQYIYNKYFSPVMDMRTLINCTEAGLPKLQAQATFCNMIITDIENIIKKAKELNDGS